MSERNTFFMCTGSVLESILSVEACKMGLPTLEALLSHPLFADETVITVGIKPQLKVMFEFFTLFQIIACKVIISIIAILSLTIFHVFMLHAN